MELTVESGVDKFEMDLQSKPLLFVAWKYVSCIYSVRVFPRGTCGSNPTLRVISLVEATIFL
jgi:hypothetical protein